MKPIDNSYKINFLRFWLPVYLYAALIFFYSSLSQPPIIPRIFHLDKMLHLIEYAILGYLIARAAYNSANSSLKMHFRAFAVIIGFLYALSDEFHQYFVPGRYVEVLDVAADGLGAFVGQLFLRVK